MSKEISIVPGMIIRHMQGTYMVTSVDERRALLVTDGQLQAPPIRRSTMGLIEDIAKGYVEVISTPQPKASKVPAANQPRLL